MIGLLLNSWRWGAALLALLGVAGWLHLEGRKADKALQAAIWQAEKAGAEATSRAVTAATLSGLQRQAALQNEALAELAKRRDVIERVRETLIKEQIPYVQNPNGSIVALDPIGVCLFNQAVDVANGGPSRLCPAAASDVPVDAPVNSE
jgi:hypothetical protein